MISLKSRVMNKRVLYVVSGIILLCGVATSLTMYYEETKRVYSAQNLSGSHLVNTLTAKLDEQSANILSVASLIKTSHNTLTQRQFESFIRGLTNVGDVGFYFAQYVPHNRKTDYEMNQQLALGNPDFFISPAGDREEYLPLTLAYPNQLEHGYDLLYPQYSHAESVRLARDSFDVTLSKPSSIALPGWVKRTIADTFILKAPVYLPFDIRRNKLTDRVGFHGIVGSYFRMGALLESISTLNERPISYRMANIEEDGAVNWFLQTAEDSVWSSRKFFSHTMTYSGRQYRVDMIHTTPVKGLINWSVVITPLLFFALLACILTFYVHKLSTAYHRALDVVRKNIEEDELTGLHSRYRIQQIIDNQLNACKQEEKCLAALVVDLDDFRNINDAFGYDVGDKLLASVGQRLLSLFSNRAEIGYLGEDGFLILLSRDDVNDSSQLEALVQDSIKQLGQSYFVAGRTLSISCSVGVALAPEFGQDAVTLMKNADMAVYQAKFLGRSSYYFYNGEMGERLERNRRIESRLRYALKKGEFELHFQPKVDLTSDACVGLEALLRWNDSELGSVSPAEFVPIAEQTGIIVPLGEWVFEQTFRHILAWKEQGLSVPPVAINCSAEQLKRANFLPHLLSLLDEYRVDPSSLEIELTESILIEDPEGCAEVLRHISRLGITIALDDFGTGYSSMSYLKDLPFDSVKIDQIFIREIMLNKSDAALTKAIISLSHDLGMKVVAEGIDNEEQLVLLREFGCDIGQGYLFSKPISSQALEVDPMIVELSK
ncbi:EAL domain-containing protein [Marinomonas sp. C2222]|uniref:EAL domain-containing protein n=1 Tax=Marinomonas sargassi TaxID=2984494 RepID=A0ABT2YQQ4_9GAMM|nr:EAL domain-containing protein [Marinomonas sargassi]MCV2402223.1 EAL domain-containing protein [Marinomonas sargassi]